jgi:hypothetical protein
MARRAPSADAGFVLGGTRSGERREELLSKFSVLDHRRGIDIEKRYLFEVGGRLSGFVGPLKNLEACMNIPSTSASAIRPLRWYSGCSARRRPLASTSQGYDL